MYDLTKFTLSQMITCGAELRDMSTGAGSMEEVAGRIVHHLYEQLGDPDQEVSACALVRMYKTHPYHDLEPDLQDFVRTILDSEPDPTDMKCPTLLATVGERPEWNDRTRSAGHRAIPLASEQMVSQIPMITQLVKQFGLEIGHVLQPDPELLVDLEQQTYNVFHVPDAEGSPYIPAQEEFVIPYGIKSVVGFGGMLPSGDLFTVIIFAKVPVPRETADLFKSLSLSVKMSVLPFSGGPVFA